MAAQMQININSGVSPATVKLPPAQDVWDSLGRRLSVDPSPLNVEPGDQIFWTNNDSQPHWPSLKNADGTIDNSFFMPNQIAGTSDMGPSTSPTFSPGVEGTLTYVCCLRHYVSGDPCEWRSCSVEGTIVVTAPR
jgi:plastocyanin